MAEVFDLDLWHYNEDTDCECLYCGVWIEEGMYCSDDCEKADLL